MNEKEKMLEELKIISLNKDKEDDYNKDDNDGDADDDEVYIPRRSRNTPTTQQQKESDSSVIIAKKITLGKLIQKISSILESVKQDIASRTGSRSSSNSLHLQQQQQQGEILSRKAYLWTTMEDFRLLTSEKMKLVEELLWLGKSSDNSISIL